MGELSFVERRTYDGVRAWFKVVVGEEGTAAAIFPAVCIDVSGANGGDACGWVGAEELDVYR